MIPPNEMPTGLHLIATDRLPVQFPKSFLPNADDDPLEGDIIVIGCRCLAPSGVAAAVERADGIGLEFDDELLNHLLDRLLAARHLDCAIVFARGEFALHEDVRAFRQSWSDLREALPVSNDIVPLRSVFPFAFFVLPRARRGDGELSDGSSVRQLLGFGVLADETDYGELIEVH